MKYKLPLICSVLISILISALIHVVDVNVNGIQGLFSANVILSVIAYSIIPFFLMMMILSVSFQIGIKAGIFTLLILSCLSSIFLILLGGTATTVYQYISNFLLQSLIFMVLFSLGTVIPHVIFSNRHK